MELSQELKELIELEAEKLPLKELISAAERISFSYRENKGGGDVFIRNRTDALAYAAVRLPATFAAVSGALEKTAGLFGDGIFSMLDVGAGCGAAAIAGREIFPSLENITCIEREKQMLEIGKTLIGCDWRQEDIRKADFPKADLAAASYVLNEIPEEERGGLVKKLWEAAEKLVVITEPGTPAGYKGLMEMREELISLGAKILAPCPHSGECPLNGDDWCHFTARTSRSRLHKKLKGAEAPFEDEKYCFIAAVKTDAAPCKARILRHPKIESGRIGLRLCTQDGITEKLVTKKDGADFKKARKSGAGDAF